MQHRLSIFLLGLAVVYLSNQRHLSLVLLFLAPPLDRHLVAAVPLIYRTLFNSVPNIDDRVPNPQLIIFYQ